ncbi:hypothetical protein D3C81_1306290 [compost metagenome]
MLVGTQTDIRVAGLPLCQLHQPKEVYLKNEAVRLPQQAHVDASLPAQASRVQALPLQHVHQLTDKTDINPIHRPTL